MNDRELLELAAKAAGLEFFTNIEVLGAGVWIIEKYRSVYSGERTEYLWNPLDDDGDAMRLSSRLYLDVCFYRGFEEVIVQGEGTKDTPISLGEILEVREPFGIDIASATRRAIVRAAAEIGRGM